MEYFFEETSKNLLTPLKENGIILQQPENLAEVATPKNATPNPSIQKRLLASNEKDKPITTTKKKKKNSLSPSKVKTPSKSPSSKSAVKSAKKSAKKTPSSGRKKKIVDLENEIKEIEESLQKLKKESSKTKAKLTKLSNSGAQIKFPVKDELIEKIDSKGRPLLPLPDPLLKLEDILPEDSIHDAISVWNFLNAFNKQLSVVSISWDDFLDLLKFNSWTSQALVDLFSAPLKLILADQTSASRILGAIPKKCHFTQKVLESNADENDASFLDRSFSLPNVPANFINSEFDAQYNGLKLVPKKIKAEMVDSLRWSSILRSLFLRLEPVRQLRKAVSEATIALQFYFETQPTRSISNESGTVRDILSKLNNSFFSWGESSADIPATKKISFESPIQQKFPSDTSEGNVDKVIELNELTMTKINTPKSKSRNKSSGLNKDAIFNITSSFVSSLNEIYDVAKQLELKEIHELSPRAKLIVLKVLCDACLDTERIQKLMEHNAEERATQIQTMNRIVREQKAKMKEVSSAKREAALEACRRINKEKLGIKNAKSPGNAGKKKSNQKEEKSFEPSSEQLSAMIDDLIVLESFGVDTIREDLVLEDISSDEEDGEDNENDNDGDERSSRRNRVTSRARAMSKQKSRTERAQRNSLIAVALEKISYALERNSERELRNAIKSAERAGFKGVDENGQTFCTEALKQVFKQLHELENRANEDKIVSKHEKALEEFFVRTEPLGSDRHFNIYWRFMADENRLFVESKSVDASSGDGIRPPSKLSDGVLNKLFASRPNKYKHTWKVYSTPTELWKLCEALDDRGEREKELKAAIKARYEIEPPAAVYQSTGSEYIGRKVQRAFGRKTVFGTIVGWLPPTDEDQALWHVVHLDGDEEDLDEEEVKSALVEENETESKEEMATNVALDEENPSSDMDVDGESAANEPGTGSAEKVIIPAIVKRSNGLNKSGHYARNLSGLFGLMGLAQETIRFVNIIAESLKKRCGERFTRESKKNFETMLRGVESLQELKQHILEVEDIIHSIQSKPDRREEEEKETAKEREKQSMIDEGWCFDSSESEFIGRKGRRFFPKFGSSDGVIVAMLPSEKNDGVTLYRLQHDDGDREDLEEDDLLVALRYFDEDLQEADVVAEEEEESEDEGSEDSDDEPADDSSTVSDSFRKAKGFLWPTFEVRERWQEAVRASATVGELSLALAALEEHSFEFGVFGDLDPVFPLTLFAPTDDPFTSSSTNRTSSGRQHHHHDLLSPRKAKKRAISEISRCQREENRPIVESTEPRRSKRKTETDGGAVNQSEYYNSGRPSRAAAQKVVNYVV